MAVGLTIETQSIDNYLSNYAKFGRQMPFAESVAINSIALKVQAFEFKRLPGIFRLRKNWAKPRTKFGINAKFSNKRKLVASVFSRADWLKLQERGGVKRPSVRTPLVGKDSLLIPAKSIRKLKGRLIQKKFSPAKLLANPDKNKVFFVDTPGGGLILQRKGKGRSSKTRVLFFVEDQARIPAILNFESEGERVVKKIYPREFQVSIDKAQSTARIK